MSMLRNYTLIFFTMMNLKIRTQNTVPQGLNTREKIGWIQFNKNIDNINFVICDELNIEEYYQVNPSYKEGIISIREYFYKQKNILNKLCKKDGYIIVRFVINCQGETDRYRSNFMSFEYIEDLKVNLELQNTIIILIREMGFWNAGKYGNKSYDSYQHIKFIFKDNNLIDVLF